MSGSSSSQQQTAQNTNLTQDMSSALAQAMQSALTQEQQQTQQQQQQQQATTTQQGVTTQAPYAAAEPTLQTLLSQIQGLTSNTGLTPQETAAYGQLTQNAQTSPTGSFAANATDLTNKYLTGDPTGLLGSSLTAYQNAINPIANASLDPRGNPGIQSLLDSVRQDVQNSVNGQFAGAGRDLSGLNQQYLGRGITAAEAPILLDQYNKNVAARGQAAGGLLGAATNAAGAMGANQGQAFNFAGLIDQLRNAGPSAILAIQNAIRNAPVGALQALTGLTVPIAGLGGTTTQTGTTNQLTNAIGSLLGTMTGTQTGTQTGVQAGTQAGTQTGQMTGTTNTQTTQPWSQTWAQFMSPFKFGWGQ